ncbi:hypothetical protein NDU88_000363 [Pleurodeles waltl]|uniref:Otoancorin n=1 Tax=Pleurodeles waltl TaxID=8319 RepID=A0AAV7TER3_PLEWA|nr:hypothetical protein NDU88_000363 [Pleurodeles waltl]
MMISCSHPAGQKAENTNAKDPCNLWEGMMRQQLANNSVIIAAFNRVDLYTISEKCVATLSPLSNLTQSRNLVKLIVPDYDKMNPGSRVAIFKWIEAIHTVKSSSDTKGKDGKTSWITSDALTFLDRFMLQAPISTLSTVASMEKSALCSFYQTNSTLWKRLYDLSAAQAKILTDGLSKCGVNVTSSRVIPSLGQLTCFFANLVEKMDFDSREALKNVLPNCTRNVKDVYQKLLKYIDYQNLTSDALKSLGKAATGLNRDQIVSLSPSIVNQSLESLGKLKGWSMQQRKALVKKVNVTEQELPRMGALMAGLSVGVLKQFKGSAILKAFNSSDDAFESTKNMSKVQRKAIVGQVLKDGDLNIALMNLPKSMVKEVPLGLLKGVNSSVAEELLKGNPDLSRPQLMALMKKLKLENLNSGKAISDLKSGVRGLSCADISQLNMEALSVLGNGIFISPLQLSCAAKQYFKLMNKDGNFQSLKQNDPIKIPASFLLNLPSLKDLKTIPGSLCPSVLMLQGQADINLLARSSPRRGELINFVKSCLNITNTNMLTADQATSLGSLVCTFGRAEITDLPSAIFNEMLPQFISCRKFEESAKEAMRQKILATSNATSAWTKETLVKLGILASVLKKDDLATIPNTEDVKSALLAILASEVRPSEAFTVPDYDTTPDIQSLSEKLASIYTNPAASTSPTRKRRAVDCANTAPDADTINILKEFNVGWKPEQLNCLTNETFINGLETLSRVQGFSTDQLVALKNKAMQVFGSPLPLDQIAALRRITLAFSESEVNTNFNGIDTDTLVEISGYREWATSMYTAKSGTIVKYYLSNGRQMASLSDTDLVALGYFLCVLNPEQIRQINSTAYSGAAMYIGKLMCPDNVLLTALKSKAVEVFGAPSTWTREICQEVGTVAAGLTPAEISQLQSSVIPSLTPEAILLLPTKVFSSLTAAQLLNLGPENFSVVSDQQKSSLSPSQRDAFYAGRDFSNPSGSGSTHWLSMSAFTLVTLALMVAL